MDIMALERDRGVSTNSGGDGLVDRIIVAPLGGEGGLEEDVVGGGSAPGLDLAPVQLQAIEGELHLVFLGDLRGVQGMRGDRGQCHLLGIN